MLSKPLMTKKQEELFHLFKHAIDMERAQQQLYLDAIALCDDETLKSVLRNFHGNEVAHEELLGEKYREYRERFALDDASDA
jgi:rubrerythrin